MSATPSIDAYDAQMLDFSSDTDVPMHITGTAEFFAEALMEHDDHLAASTYSEHASVEVDMEEYFGDGAEYEMADETAEYPRSHGDELLDIEVYDASHAPSPLAPPQPLQPSVDVTIESEHPEPTSTTFLDHAAPPEVSSESEPEVHPAPLDQPAADATHVEPSAPAEGVPSEVASNLAHPADVPGESVFVASESHEQLGDVIQISERTSEGPAPVDAQEVEPHVPLVVEEHRPSSEVAPDGNLEPPMAESAPLAGAEGTYHSGSLAEVEKAVEQALVTEGETVDPLQISDGVYIDPPPAVLLSISDPSPSQFALFNSPEVEGEVAEETHSNQKVYSLLLENRPTLYYEPLSTVFGALRQDEDLLSRVPHSFEGELVLDAYDLQLAVSEDNIHSREISLHDLNILHDGSNFVGPLRLILRASTPRFIIRYYEVQDQIQRLAVAAETGEGDHGEDHQERYDTSEEQRHPEQEEAADHSSAHTTVVSDGLEAPPAVETEEQNVKESAVCARLSEVTPAGDYESEDASAVEEPSAEYHEVTGEASHALEDEDDYEGTNAGDEDESAGSGSLDADQVHETAGEDTDAAATVTGQGSEFGGEQTEYLDYVQPEEYDERYGEDLPERAGGASPVQYGEPPHYEEEGELDTSTAVDETQVVLPGSDEDEDKSVATPIPPRAVLEPESNQPAEGHTIGEPSPSKQEFSVPSNGELTTGEFTNEVHADNTSNSKETSTAQEKLFAEVNESDSNFISMLEREADAEFDQTFNAEQSGQEGGIAAALQHEEAWDEWDDEDAEGEDEEDWVEPDAVSNESSTTLSSKGSSKRGYDEMDPSEELNAEDPQSSPGSKRPRVQ